MQYQRNSNIHYLKSHCNHNFFADIDECSEGLDNCSVNAVCENVMGTFQCTCKDGYKGDGVTCSGELKVTLPLLVVKMGWSEPGPEQIHSEMALLGCFGSHSLTTSCPYVYCQLVLKLQTALQSIHR